MADQDADDAANLAGFDMKARLRTRRLELNLSQEEVAKRAGLSYRRYQDFEGDSRPFNPTLATLRRLARALETTLAGLLAEPGEVVSVVEGGSVETPGEETLKEPTYEKATQEKTLVEATKCENASTAGKGSTAQEGKKKGKKKKRVRKKR